MIMKRIICIAIAFILVNCELKTKESFAAGEFKPLLKHNEISDYSEITKNEMTFGVFRVYQYNTGYSISIVNLTKDRLEVEKLKLEITKLTKENNATK